MAEAQTMVLEFPASEIDYVRLSHQDDPSHQLFFRAVPATFAKKFVLTFVSQAPAASALLDEMVGLHGAVSAGVQAVAERITATNARVAGTFDQMSDLTGTGISMENANSGMPVATGVPAKLLRWAAHRPSRT